MTDNSGSLLNGYVDDRGRVASLPGKESRRILVIDYIASKISNGPFTESEFNDEIKKNISFEDYAIVRRELIDRNAFTRTKDGRSYCRSKRI
ncbi:DUF2087 domain-containing protein [Oenococcus sicerae]|uniref:DUF2087 domain-containing protein n=1 Tax=Oenococcus sicerae TaxID=2203724 RepID=UPI0010B66605|nr:hypothetical protein OAL24_01223 [Oenococcus sicerae]